MELTVNLAKIADHMASMTMSYVRLISATPTYGNEKFLGFVRSLHFFKISYQLNRVSQYSSI